MHEKLGVCPDPDPSGNFVAFIAETGTIQFDECCPPARPLSTPVGGLARRGPVTQTQSPRRGLSPSLRIDGRNGRQELSASNVRRSRAYQGPGLKRQDSRAKTQAPRLMALR